MLSLVEKKPLKHMWIWAFQVAQNGKQKTRKTPMTLITTSLTTMLLLLNLGSKFLTLNNGVNLSTIVFSHGQIMDAMLQDLTESQSFCPPQAECFLMVISLVKDLVTTGPITHILPILNARIKYASTD